MRKEDELNGTEIARRVAQEFVRENDLVPLSILSLDHPEPIDGWSSLGIEIVEDDLLRPCLRREDARKIVRKRREQERVESSRRLEVLETPLVAVGVPAIDGGSPVEALAATGDYQTPAEEFGGRPKPNFLEDELAAGARQLAAAQAAAEEQKAVRDK